jgi:hypothetical protein
VLLLPLVAVKLGELLSIEVGSLPYKSSRVSKNSPKTGVARTVGTVSQSEVATLTIVFKRFLQMPGSFLLLKEVVVQKNPISSFYIKSGCLCLRVQAGGKVKISECKQREYMPKERKRGGGVLLTYTIVRVYLYYISVYIIT